MIGLAVAYAGLLVSVATLLWRVWRLEERVGRKAPSGPDWDHMLKVEGRINDSYGYARGVDRALGDLARALGYEWKRTDAKEGWEKKSPFGFGDYDAYKESVKRAFGAPPLWIHAGPAACVADRRKADRRKPAPQAAPKSPPKKRRAH